jgi:3-methyladenine DNA glycosylase AlkD
MYQQIIKDLQKYANSEKAKLLSRFFKTGKGEYGEGDVFIGVVVPQQRLVAKKYKTADLKTVEQLLHSKIHEHRLTALLILTYQLKKADEIKRKQFFDFYLKNTQYINNWDLVDLSCRDIIGEYLLDKDRKIIYQLARSKNLWERRIAIISTFAFIRKNQLQDTLRVSKILLNDKHDLIHKAVGWALRELGKKDEKLLEEFLNKNIKSMPRTMLRYAIEKFSEDKRRKYLNKPLR